MKIRISPRRGAIWNLSKTGDHVVLEVLWTGTLAVPFGSIPVGGTLRARFAVFLDFQDGRIAAQRNYDCFDPW